MKCLQYWPEEKDADLRIGDFNISLRSSEMFSDFAVNTLAVTKVRVQVHKLLVICNLLL